MYKFIFNYLKSEPLEYSGIIKAIQTDAMDKNVVEGDNLLSYDYLTNYDIKLISNNAAYTISCEGLKSIEVVKEPD